MSISQKKFSITFLLCFFVAVFSFLCTISSGYIDSEDGWLYASVARNIYYHHQISAAPDEYPDFNVHMNSVKGSDGVWRTSGSLGYSLSMLPAVALSDLVHRAYHTEPPQHFPLEHDWSFHLFASFTNAFYGAVLAVVLLLYANELHFSRRASLAISLLTLCTTSLLPLTKFSFAHMMFISFLLAAFYFIKRFSTTQSIRYLFLAAISFLVVFISYNETAYLTILPLGLYLLVLETPRQRRITIFFGLIGLIFILIGLRTLFLSLVMRIFMVSPKILFEGVWGFLFSPGKSIFLYTPQLLIIPLFWHKIKKTVRPELIAAIVLSLIYLYVIGGSAITKDGMLQPIWHGGMNWGTRYISPLIPLWMIIVFYIIQSLTSFQKKFIVIPLFVMGAWVQLVGVSTSYLLQYIDLPYNYFIGKTEILVYDYSSFIPRYTPIYTLSKQFFKNVINFPETIARSKYNVKFFDGFDVPYKPSSGPIRGFREFGYISFINDRNDTPTKLSFEIYNAPDAPDYQTPAQITISLNGNVIKEFTAVPQQNESFAVSLDPTRLNDTNQLVFKASYPAPLIVPQVIYVRKMLINDTTINLGSLDYPDMSNLGPATTTIPYVYTGKVVTSKWVFWQIRGRMNERTLDFWWIKNLYYWDRPVQLIWGLAAINLIALLSSSFLLVRSLKRMKYGE